MLVLLWCRHAKISDWVAKYTQFMVPTSLPPPPINIKPDLGFPREYPRGREIPEKSHA